MRMSSRPLERDSGGSVPLPLSDTRRRPPVRSPDSTRPDALTRPESDLPEKNTPTRIAVIIPVRNEQQHIESVLVQLLKQDHPESGVEILVVDGQSTDRTRDIVRAIAASHSMIRLLDNPDRLSSSARNIGIANSTAEIVVIIDGHCELPGTSYFTDLLEAFERTGADCLGRPQSLDVTGASHLQAAIAAARSSPLGHHPDSFIYSNQEIKVPAISVAVAYRRRVFATIGMFDPQFDACEDCELNYRADQAGMDCYLIPQLAVNYQPRSSLGGLFRQMARYGSGRMRLARKHPGTRSWKPVLPALFLAGLVSGPPICWLIPPLWSLYVGVIALYAATVILFSVLAAGRRRRMRLLIWLPLVFATIHAGSGYGWLSELFRGKRLSPEAAGT